jgi:hypothetical protein
LSMEHTVAINWVALISAFTYLQMKSEGVK